MPQDFVLQVDGLSKIFVLHTQNGIELPVFEQISFTVGTGECLALSGPSGAGKSTLLRSLYANYLPTAGKILVWHRDDVIDLASAEPRLQLEVRRETIGYVSQFLRVIPRISSENLVAEAAIAGGVAPVVALDAARSLLKRLNLPERLWSVPPATFSGGEQQRVNIARGIIRPFPILLLDEPTASLDAENRAITVELILEAKARGAAIVAICHDEDERGRLADRVFDVSAYKVAG